MPYTFMHISLKFDLTYFVSTIALLLIEILISKYLNDPFIRPYFGDFLVVILIYCFVKSFFNTPVFPTLIAVLLFSYFIEALQYFNIVNKLGLQHSSLARTIIGTSAEWTDIVAYTCGIITTYYLERTIFKRTSLTSKNGR